VEEALVGEPLILRGPDGRYLAYGRAEHGRCSSLAVGSESSRRAT
jgi:hypothetical protein